MNFNLLIEPRTIHLYIILLIIDTYLNYKSKHFILSLTRFVNILIHFAVKLEKIGTSIPSFPNHYTLLSFKIPLHKYV